MPDPVGLIGSINNQDLPALAPKQAEGPGFKNLLQEQIDKVNQLQRDATEAIEDLATGRRDDVESVLIATQKVKATTAGPNRNSTRLPILTNITIRASSRTSIMLHLPTCSMIRYVIAL